MTKSYFKKLEESIDRLTNLIKEGKIGDLRTGQMAEIIKKLEELKKELNDFFPKLKELYELESEEIEWDWEKIVEYA